LLDSLQLSGVRSFSTGKKSRVLKEGEAMPQLNFNLEGVSSYNAKMHSVYSSEDLFAGKRTLIFHDWLFAPKNFRQYLPVYEQLYDSIKAMGIDDVFCASFHDGHIMRQLFLEQGCIQERRAGKLGFRKVKPLPGGNRLFRSTNLCSWSNINVSAIQSFQHSAAIINDMKVEKLITEENSVGDSKHAPEGSQNASAPKVLDYLQQGAYAEDLFSQTAQDPSKWPSSGQYIQGFVDFDGHGSPMTRVSP
jgi:peroxiredoxin